MRTSTALAAAILILALAGPAAAIEPAPPSSPLIGELEILKDRRAGTFEDVETQSQQVSYVRDGSERPAMPGMALHEGDAIRTTDGVCLLATSEGTRIQVGERSQVRLERGILQRLGRVHYVVAGTLSVRVGELELSATAADFEVQSSPQGAGRLLVRRGEVQLGTGGDALAVAAGTMVAFTAEGPAEPEPTIALELTAVEAWRAERFEIGPPEPPSQRERARIRLEGGVSWFEELQGWGRGGLEGRVRLGGPVWISTGAAFAGRRAWELEEAENVFAVPIHLGLRLSGDLPSSFFITGGADFQLVVMGRCDDQTTCSRQTVAEPGGRLLIGAGLLLSRRFGLDLEFSGGVLRRQIPPVVEGGEPTDVVDPQFHLGIGFFLRL